jgi:hypothetical protein
MSSSLALGWMDASSSRTPSVGLTVDSTTRSGLPARGTSRTLTATSDDLPPVPTVAELVGMGLAWPDRSVRKGQVARIHVSDEGHALMGERMRARALRQRDENERPEA